MPSVIDLTGQRFGRLVVVERTENKGVKVQWKCLCDCGRYCSITSDMLLKGKLSRAVALEKNELGVCQKIIESILRLKFKSNSVRRN